MIITSRDNPIIKQTKKLVQNSKIRKKEGAFIAEGLRLCRDVAQNGGVILTALVTQRFLTDFPHDAAIITKDAHRVLTVSDGILSHLADTDSPQGVLCVCQKPAFALLPQKGGRFVILENVSDPANVGAIARTAEALGVDGILLSGGCDPYHPKALRASMGALLRLPIYEGAIDEILACMQTLKVETFAAVVSGADCGVTEVAFGTNCAIVIGNEANGITPETAAACDKRITIPMAGRAESLNAAAAACILVWEMTERGKL